VDGWLRGEGVGKEGGLSSHFYFAVQRRRREKKQDKGQSKTDVSGQKIGEIRKSSAALVLTQEATSTISQKKKNNLVTKPKKGQTRKGHRSAPQQPIRRK